MPADSPPRSRPKETSEAVESARENRARRIVELRARDRLLPSLDLYDQKLYELTVAGNPEPNVLGMSYLTEIFLGTFEVVRKQIANAGKIGISATNAIKRSAGTNFQGLCEYAILRWLDTIELPINVGPNAPKRMKDELTIYGRDVSGDFSVEPDIDICLWQEGGGDDSPIIFVSAKTSLVDRAGQAARWKLYLDLHQTTCQHMQSVPDCPIHRTRVKIKTSHPIEHCIVTANIYKITSTQPQGELTSGQCRNNTYMFLHRYTTRNDATEIRPAGWASFSEFTKLVQKTFQARPRRLPLSRP